MAIFIGFFWRLWFSKRITSSYGLFPGRNQEIERSQIVLQWRLIITWWFVTSSIFNTSLANTSCLPTCICQFLRRSWQGHSLSWDDFAVCTSIKFGTNTIYRHIVLNGKHEDKCREKLDNFKSSEFPTMKIPKWQKLGFMYK